MLLTRPVTSLASLSIRPQMIRTAPAAAAALATAPTSTAPSLTPAIRPGLDRILPLLTRLKQPQNGFAVIHIAGTNSKGSTSSLIDSLLGYSHLRTARFNSPHLRRERDCCRIAGNVVDISTWNTAAQLVKEANDVHQDPSRRASPFELLFARFLISCTLVSPRPQVLIVECGMGGLMDATNVFPPQSLLASVITPIGRDHAGFLGDSLREITENKMGIAKEYGLVVVADQAASKPSLNPRQWSAVDEDATRIGDDSVQVLSTIRRMAETLKARLVRCDASHRLESVKLPVQVNDSWRITSQWSVLLPPILQSPSSTQAAASDPATGVSLEEGQSSDSNGSAKLLLPADALASSLFTNQPFLTLPGHAARQTPFLPALQPTAPVLSSVSTALSTLYAIASDEPPSARLSGGADPHEELRLSLAWTLREAGLLSGTSGELSKGFQEAVIQGIESWEGRGSWVEIPQTSAGQVASPCQLFVDGAHNLPALSALFRHLQAMRQARGSLQLTITFIVSFSESKKNDGDLDAILNCFARLPQSLARTTRPTHSEEEHHPLARDIDELSIRIGFVPFSTPVEGMPWVAPLHPEELTTLMKEKVSLSQDAQWEVVSLADLESALQWATKQGKEDGRPASQKVDKRDSMVVLTGSLYLTGELYRLVDQLTMAA